MSGSKTIFFPGAGASKSICEQLPLASQLTLAHLLEKNNYGHQTGAPEAINNLDQWISTREDRNRLLSRPIEEALSVLPRLAPPHFPFENLLICLYRRLSLLEQEQTNPHVIAWLEDARRNGHAIISPNYDTLVEQHLANHGTGEFLPNDAVDRDALHWIDYGVPEEWQEESELQKWPTPPERSILFLKLHGSNGWTSCQECRTPNLDRLHQFGAEWATTGMLPCSICACETRHTPVLVPPLIDKGYSDRVITEIWNRATAILSQAQDIIFAGFSLNPFDKGIHGLLRNAHLQAKTNRVIVVDPSAEVLLPRYRGIYGDAVQIASVKTWKEYLETRYPLS